MVSTIQAALKNQCAVKIISGLDNFDPALVAQVTRAAAQGGATYVDIACNQELIQIAKAASALPVCVSALTAEDLIQAVAWGADLVELGNFDSCDRVYSAEEILTITQQTRQGLPREVLLCVTVPHTLNLVEQVQLAQALEAAGADLLQTEGGTSAQPSHSGILGLIEKAAPTLAAAHVLSRAVQIPVLCASGLSPVTVPLAIAAGACGVGIGRAVNRLSTEIEMVASVRALVEALKAVSVPAL
jgi:hypothetical protein